MWRYMTPVRPFFEGHRVWRYITLAIKPFFVGHQMLRYITLVRPSSSEQPCDENQSGLHSSEDDSKLKKNISKIKLDVANSRLR